MKTIYLTAALIAIVATLAFAGNTTALIYSSSMYLFYKNGVNEVRAKHYVSYDDFSTEKVNLNYTYQYMDPVGESCWQSYKAYVKNTDGSSLPLQYGNFTEALCEPDDMTITTNWEEYDAVFEYPDAIYVHPAAYTGKNGGGANVGIDIIFYDNGVDIEEDPFW